MPQLIIFVIGLLQPINSQISYLGFADYLRGQAQVFLDQLHQRGTATPF